MEKKRGLDSLQLFCTINSNPKPGHPNSFVDMKDINQLCWNRQRFLLQSKVIWGHFSNISGAGAGLETYNILPYMIL